MGSRPLPLPLAEHVQELCGRPSGCVDRENGRLDRPGVVSEPLRVEFLIETLDHRRIFREEPAESDRCDHLAVGHMVDDLAKGPFGRRWEKVQPFRRHGIECPQELRVALTVSVDQRSSRFAGH